MLRNQGKTMVERQKKIEDEFPRNVAECTVDNLRDTRTRKVLYTYNLNIIIRNKWIPYGKNKPLHLNKNIQSKRVTAREIHIFSMWTKHSPEEPKP